jgi:hypothetical protein
MKKKIRRRIESPISFLYPTSDDWSPNFPRDTIRIRVHLYYDCYPVGTVPDGMIRISASGADDTGMEKDERLPMSEYDKRLEEIRYWCDNSLPNPITKEWLLNQGFKYW